MESTRFAYELFRELSGGSTSAASMPACLAHQMASAVQHQPRPWSLDGLKFDFGELPPAAAAAPDCSASAAAEMAAITLESLLPLLPPSTAIALGGLPPLGFVGATPLLRMYDATPFVQLAAAEEATRLQRIANEEAARRMPPPPPPPAQAPPPAAPHGRIAGPPQSAVSLVHQTVHRNLLDGAGGGGGLRAPTDTGFSGTKRPRPDDFGAHGGGGGGGGGPAFATGPTGSGAPGFMTGRESARLEAANRPGGGGGGGYGVGGYGGGGYGGGGGGYGGAGAASGGGGGGGTDANPQPRRPGAGLSKAFTKPRKLDDDGGAPASGSAAGGGGGAAGGGAAGARPQTTNASGLTAAAAGGGAPSGLFKPDSRLLKRYGTEENIPEEVRKLDPKLIEAIEGEILSSASVQRTTFDDVAGLQIVKSTLAETIMLPLVYPEFFAGRKLLAASKGVLMFGPPGTGKTFIARAVASEVDATFFSISCSSLVSKWIGESERLVRALFALANALQPSIIFIDEIDSMLTARSDGEQDATRRLKTEFLVQLDGVSGKSSDSVLVIGATNRPSEIDEAARRRFTKRVYVPLPDAESRQALIKNALKRHDGPSHLADDEMEQLVTRTEGYSGADLDVVCIAAARCAFSEALIAADAVGETAAEEIQARQPVLGMRHFIAAMDTQKKSVKASELTHYEEWNKEFGVTASSLMLPNPVAFVRNHLAKKKAAEAASAAAASAAAASVGGGDVMWVEDAAGGDSLGGGGGGWGGGGAAGGSSRPGGYGAVGGAGTGARGGGGGGDGYGGYGGGY